MGSDWTGEAEDTERISEVRRARLVEDTKEDEWGLNTVWIEQRWRLLESDWAEEEGYGVNFGTLIAAI